MGGLRAAVVALLVLIAVPAGARAATTTEQIVVPSRHVDIGKEAVGPPPPGGAPRPNALSVAVTLPEGYREHPRRRYPVLFLLHGAAQAFDHWAAPAFGDIPRRAEDLGAIVVMPQGGVIGFYSDWHKRGPGWESYYLRELIPAVERRYRVRPGRRWHAIVGLSMGGYGATYLASQLPGYFGTAASFSGVLSPQDDENLDVVAQAILPAALPGFAWRDVFGPPGGFNAIGHNPSLLLDNLAHTRLFASSGDAAPCPGDNPAPTDFGGLGPQSAPLFQGPLSAAIGPPLFIALEQIVRTETETFLRRAQAAGVPVQAELGCGIHWWETFRRGFDAAKRWGFFATPPPAPRRWTYTTASRRAEAWGLRLRLADPPTALTTVRRAGRTLRAEGAGTLTVRMRRCRFAAELPFTKRLPPRCRG